MEDRWYVLRDLARPNAKNPAYKQLQEMPSMKDCVFVPLKQHVFTEFGRRVVRFVPYMPDLVFVHKSKEELDPIVRQIELLQYRYVRGGKQFEAMSIPHDVMDSFMRAVHEIDLVEYYSYEEVSPRLYGKQIRIVGGRLNGLIGRLMSKRGSKYKRLLIDLQECNLSAAIQVNPEYIQLVK
ncbi:MAG: UpxY family transcription antiterminator [Parabacteroides sp.]